MRSNIRQTFHSKLMLWRVLKQKKLLLFTWLCILFGSLHAASVASCQENQAESTLLEDIDVYCVYMKTNLAQRGVKMGWQAELGVPHSRIQVEFGFILQSGTCQILNFAQNPRQSQSVQGTELNWGGTPHRKFVYREGGTPHIFSEQGANRGETPHILSE